MLSVLLEAMQVSTLKSFIHINNLLENSDQIDILTYHFVSNSRTNITSKIQKCVLYIRIFSEKPLTLYRPTYSFSS